MVDLLEAYLNELELKQVAYRSIRWLWRRLLGSRSGARRVARHRTAERISASPAGCADVQVAGER
jgi:hypothetical protein